MASIVVLERSIVSPDAHIVKVPPLDVKVPPPKKVKSTGVPTAPTSISLIVPASPIITVPLESRGFNIRSEPDIFISAYLSLEVLKNSKGCPLYILCLILKT